MRLVLTFLTTILMTSCAITYSGVIKNNYKDAITVNSLHGVRGNSVLSANQSTEVPIFSTKTGTCIEISRGLQTEYYKVPKPPEWSKTRGMWDVKFGLSVSAEGAFYIGTNGESLKLKEVPSCNT